VNTRICRTAIAALLLWTALAAPALGAVLELSTGELVPGKVESLDDTGVSFVRESGSTLRVTWDLVVPGCRYDLVRESLAPGDAAGRVKLGKWCAEQGMFRAARRELLEAKGLVYAGPEDLDALLATVRRTEADAALEAVDGLTDQGELDTALERLKSYLRTADPGPDADRVRARVPGLIQRIERRDEETRKADDDRKKAEKDGRLKEWIERNLKSADALRDEGGEAAADAFAQIAKGNQTRSRDALAKAEQRYQSARAAYARVRKAVKDGAAADTCAEHAKDCDGRTVEVLTRWGRLEAGNKNWKQASAVVDRGLKIDAVSRELLELRATIDKNWIRRKMSDTSNARGHASSY